MPKKRSPPSPASERTVYVQLRQKEGGRLRHCKGLTIRVRQLTPNHVYTVVARALKEEVARLRAKQHGLTVPGENDERD